MTCEKLVFLGGLHRSGTTLLARILATHPEISGLSNTGVIEDEGQLLQSVYRSDLCHGGPGRFAFDRDAHLTEYSSLNCDDSRLRLLKAWMPYWDTSRRIWLEKSPPNLIRGRFLQSLFPDSHFIFIVRHPIPTSIATYKWSGTGIYSLIHHWVEAHDLMRQDSAVLKRVRIISYERFVRDPGTVLSDLESFLGISRHSYAVAPDFKVNARYFDQWSDVFLSLTIREKPVPSRKSFYGTGNALRDFNPKRTLKRFIKNRVFGKHRQLSNATYEAQDAICMFEDRVQEHGYSLVNLARVPDY